MTLLQQLQAAGVRTYGEAIWVAGDVVTSVTTGDNIVVTASTKFDNVNQLVIKEGNALMYIPLRAGTDPAKTQYTLQKFTASRDWIDAARNINIKQGDVRVFAI